VFVSMCMWFLSLQTIVIKLSLALDWVLPCFSYLFGGSKSCSVRFYCPSTVDYLFCQIIKQVRWGQEVMKLYISNGCVLPPFLSTVLQFHVLLLYLGWHVSCPS
jgi:hypothetical protein